MAGSQEDILDLRNPAQNRQAVGRGGTQADANLVDGTIGQAGGDAQSFAQNFARAAGCDAHVEARMIFACSARDDTPIGEGEQIMGMETDHNWPVPRLARSLEMEDLPALGIDWQRDAQRFRELSRPGTGGQHDALGGKALAIDLDLRDPFALAHQRGRLFGGNDPGSAQLSRAAQGVAHQAPIQARRTGRMDGSVDNPQRGKEPPGLLVAQQAHIAQVFYSRGPALYEQLEQQRQACGLLLTGGHVQQPDGLVASMMLPVLAQVGQQFKTAVA